MCTLSAIAFRIHGYGAPTMYTPERSRNAEQFPSALIFNTRLSYFFFWGGGGSSEGLHLTLIALVEY